MNDPEPLPAHYDRLEIAIEEAWERLEHGVADRHSPFHTPTLATVRADGTPSARTVVLRGADRTAACLRFHTDGRSRKLEEVAAEPRSVLHFYDPAAKIQLRVEGTASIHAADPVADDAWAASRPSSRECYRIEPGPGAAIDLPTNAVISDAADPDAGRVNFRAVILTVSVVEWLYLAARGHRRALFTRVGRDWEGAWLAP